MCPMSPRLLRPRATGFNPKSIAGIKMWLDASDSSTITLNGGNVSAWADKTGNATNASQVTAASQPAYNATGQNGRGIIEFDSTEFLTWAGSMGATALFNYLHNATGGTIVMVLRADSTSDPNAIRYILTNSNTSTGNTGIGVFLDDRAGVSRNNGLVLSVNRGVSGQATSSGLTNNAFPSANAFAVLSVALDNANATAASRIVARVNGSGITTGNTLTNTAATGNASTNMFLGNFGGGNSLNAVAEILFYEGVLATSAMSRIEKYLGTKWGVSVA